MQDISQLGFSIDSSPAVQAAQNLDRMVMAAQNAQGATAALTSSGAAYQRTLEGATKEQASLVSGLTGLGASAESARNLISALPAAADWQMTRWGMAPEDVQRAARGEAHPIWPTRMVVERDTQVDLLLAMPYRGNGFDFDAYFAFDPASRALRCVVLILRDEAQAMALAEQLVARYGRPANGNPPARPPMILGWRGLDRITLTALGLGAPVRLEYCGVGRGL